jgi:hypothetical protein
MSRTRIVAQLIAQLRNGFQNQLARRRRTIRHLESPDLGSTNHEVGSSILSGRTILPTCLALIIDFACETEGERP